MLGGSFAAHRDIGAMLDLAVFVAGPPDAVNVQ
jgi:hypothetical protein